MRVDGGGQRWGEGLPSVSFHVWAATAEKMPKASQNHILQRPSPRPCSANWPVKRLGGSHRVTKLRSPEGSAKDGRQTDRHPLPGPPRGTRKGRPPAPKVFACISQTSAFRSPLFAFLFLPPPSSLLSFLPHLLPPLIPPQLGCHFLSPCLDPVSVPELGGGEGERNAPRRVLSLSPPSLLLPLHGPSVSLLPAPTNLRVTPV